uniref:Uncharacterized protein n=1 Tax=Trypanosoma vivax (strain Y486) TaxID=1055687 RepID=G0TWH8_TRYVY|nr:hypothetical protein TVY486_0601070 [Trypanosoma vivax Y486]
MQRKRNREKSLSCSLLLTSFSSLEHFFFLFLFFWFALLHTLYRIQMLAAYFTRYCNAYEQKKKKSPLLVRINTRAQTACIFTADICGQKGKKEKGRGRRGLEGEGKR